LLLVVFFADFEALVLLLVLVFADLEAGADWTEPEQLLLLLLLDFRGRCDDPPDNDADESSK
jgi:hypothetical protein